MGKVHQTENVDNMWQLYNFALCIWFPLSLCPTTLYIHGNFFSWTLFINSIKKNKRAIKFSIYNNLKFQRTKGMWTAKGTITTSLLPIISCEQIMKKWLLTSWLKKNYQYWCFFKVATGHFLCWTFILINGNIPT